MVGNDKYELGECEMLVTATWFMLLESSTYQVSIDVTMMLKYVKFSIALMSIFLYILIPNIAIKITRQLTTMIVDKSVSRGSFEGLHAEIR